MGAQIQIRDGVAVIYGGQPLTGCTVEAEELRGGAALVIAALVMGLMKAMAEADINWFQSCQIVGMRHHFGD